MEKKTIKVKDRVFTKNDISRLWRLVKEKGSINGDQDIINFKITVVSSDGITYEGSDDEIFNDGSLLDTRKCKTVNLYFKSESKELHDLKRGIEINLTQGNDAAGEVTVQGGDQGWNSSTLEGITTIIDSTKPQPKFISFIQSSWAVISVLCLLLGYLVWIICYWLKDLRPLGIAIFPEFSISIPSNNWLLLLLLLIVFPFVIGICLLGILLSILDKLWPNIEFDFGPEHTKLEKRRRSALIALVVAVLLPIIINIFT